MPNRLHRKYVTKSPLALFLKVYFGDFVHISHVFNAYWSIPLLVYLKRRLLFPGAVCLHKVLLLA